VKLGGGGGGTEKHCVIRGSGKSFSGFEGSQIVPVLRCSKGVLKRR
jgi:hypothetical protein